uniref:Reverse transcriptase domain-containing protein n=1 Tax=Monopterus albus TaxID=43700 RepID=A0A3Q3K0Y9_MONAL
IQSDGGSIILVLQDLSAAVDTVDHALLLSQLEHLVGLRGVILNGFSYFLSNRIFPVIIDDSSSTIAPLTSGVPQGLILALLLFSLYMSPLGSIISRHNVHFHFYADDQIYVPLIQCDSSLLAPLHNCIRDVKQWLSQNFLHLNESKTEYIVFSSDPATVVSTVGPSAPSFMDTVKNLGVIFDSGLNFDKQIRTVVKSSFFHLRLLTKVKLFLLHEDLEKAIYAFITS